MTQAFKYGIIITGLIASGKSTAIKILSEQGYSFICADSIAHEMLDKKAEQIAKIFGLDLLEKNNEKVKIIKGSYNNIKITTPEDLIYAQEILSSRK